MKASKADQYKAIVSTLDAILKDIDGLLQDPLFIDNIHGEQELSLDQSIELFKNIKNNFLPSISIPAVSPSFESGRIDVS